MNNKQTQLTSTELKSTEFKSTELSSAGVFFPSGVMSLILEYCDDRGSAVKIQAVWRGYQARKGEECDCCCKSWNLDKPNEWGVCNCLCGRCGIYLADCRYTCEFYR